MEGVSPSPSYCCVLYSNRLAFQNKRTSVLASFSPLQAGRSHPWTPMKMGTVEGSNLGTRACKPAGGAAEPRAWHTEQEGRSQSPLRCPVHTEGPHPPGYLCLLESEQLHTLGDLQDDEHGSFLKRNYRKLWKTHHPTATWPSVSEMHTARLVLAR